MNTLTNKLLSFRDWAMPVTATSAPSNITIVILLGAVLSLASCTDLSELEEDITNEQRADSLLSVTETSSLHMDLIEDGLRMVTIRAPSAYTFHQESRARTEMDGPVEVTVRDSTGNVKTEVQSRRATYWSGDSEFHFREDVVVSTDQQRQLYTESLDWHQEERTIHTEEFVVITTEADSLTGYGLDGDDNLNNYSIRTVTGEFELN